VLLCVQVPTITEEERTSLTKDLTAADSFSREELGAKLKQYGQSSSPSPSPSWALLQLGSHISFESLRFDMNLHVPSSHADIKAPETGNELTEPYEFNLMFPTPIGPSGMLQGYLRPETAQGIFLNYKFCSEQNNEKMPFGVAQVGKSYRNEIAPRGGLVRQREFTQAEIEFFVKPGDKKFDKFASVRHIDLPMLPSAIQLAGKPMITKNLGQCVDDGTIANETLGYFIGRTFEFLTSVSLHLLKKLKRSVHGQEMFFPSVNPHFCLCDQGVCARLPTTLLSDLG